MPLHERQRESSWCKGAQIEFQFTPLHERQPMLFLLFRAKNKISIHASTWEATAVYQIGSKAVWIISIHASTWEATTANQDMVLAEYKFQFTPLHERQQYLFHLPNPCIRISIHASTWEATPECSRREHIPWHFNSRLYMRGNYWNYRGIREEAKFQFTPLHERQPGAGVQSATRNLFQFTPLHERQRLSASGWRRDWVISIHASTWEATRNELRNYDAGNISIHASTWEATQWQMWKARSMEFQFTPLHERQRGAPSWFDRRDQFQFTPLHERQQPRCIRNMFYYHFNSRLYMRGNKSKRRFGLFTYKFQFTPLHERQHYLEKSVKCCVYFNSRLYMRGNKMRIEKQSREFISIHASTWEATLTLTFAHVCDILFQFTPLHERQQKTDIWTTNISVFQFTPLHERQQ